ncbi:MAG: hypothetical protein ABSB22_06685 [Thermodesulfobacteriota bacterium]
MRGISEKQSIMLALIFTENRVPKDHPLRRLNEWLKKNFNGFPASSIRFIRALAGRLFLQSES